jgi:hypothetical protein
MKMISFVLSNSFLLWLMQQARRLMVAKKCPDINFALPIVSNQEDQVMI